MSGTKKVSLPIFSNGTSYAKNYLSIVCYNIPEWAKSLQNIPKEKLLVGYADDFKKSNKVCLYHYCFVRLL